MDVNTLLQQIGTGNLMACGARDFVKGETTLQFRVGSSRKLQKIIVGLVNDTYTVTFVELSRKTYDIVASEEVDGVGDHNIGAVVRRLGDR